MTYTLEDDCKISLGIGLFYLILIFFDRMFKIKSLGGKVNHKVGTDKREPYGSSDEEEFEVSTHNLLQHQ